jgi:hypothetical protein
MDTYATKRLQYWLKYTLRLGRYALFLGILWRDFGGFRVTWRAAWDVANIVFD